MSGKGAISFGPVSQDTLECEDGKVIRKALDALDAAFDFEATAEGYDFWESIADRLEAMANACDDYDGVKSKKPKLRAAGGNLAEILLAAQGFTIDKPQRTGHSSATPPATSPPASEKKAKPRPPARPRKAAAPKPRTLDRAIEAARGVLKVPSPKKGKHAARHLKSAAASSRSKSRRA